MRLIASALLLASSSALAFEGEVVDNAFTGCVLPSGVVHNLQRGDEPRRECHPRAEEARFAEIPDGLSVVSWDIVLDLDEDFSPAPGIEIVCSDQNPFVNLTITINGEVVADMATQSIGRNRFFVHHGEVSDESWFGEPFLVRAAGRGTTIVYRPDGPCESVGFAEILNPQ
jgi:hypothetical protein